MRNYVPTRSTKNSLETYSSSKVSRIARLTSAMFALAMCSLLQTAYAESTSSAPDNTPAVKLACAVFSQTHWISPEEKPWDFETVPVGEAGFEFLISLGEMKGLTEGKIPFILKSQDINPAQVCYWSGQELRAQSEILEELAKRGETDKAKALAKHCPRRLSDVEPQIKKVTVEAGLDGTLGRLLFVVNYRGFDAAGKLIYSASDKAESLTETPEISYTKLQPFSGKNLFLDDESKGKDYYVDFSFSCKAAVNSSVLVPPSGSSAPRRESQEEEEELRAPIEPGAHPRELPKKNKYFNPNKPFWTA